MVYANSNNIAPDKTLFQLKNSDIFLISPFKHTLEVPG